MDKSTFQIQTCEAQRLKVLHECQILDTPPEQSFDDLTALASYICEAPMALIGFADAERQWFKSKVGTDVEELPRGLAFCSYTIRTPDQIFVIEDALADARFADHPLVKSYPYVRFYAGVPLTTEQGHTLGTLCVIDRVPRRLSPKQEAALWSLARQAVAQIKFRDRAEEDSLKLQEKTAELANVQRQLDFRDRILQSYLNVMPAALGIIDADLRYIHLNELMASINKVPLEAHVGKSIREVLPESAPFVEPWLRRILETGEPLLNIEVNDKALGGKHSEAQSSERFWSFSYFPIPGSDGKSIGIGTVGLETTERKNLEAQLRQAQKMEAVGKLAGGIAHDFNNLLTAIIGGCAFLLQDLDAASPLCEDVEGIKRCADRAASLTRQLLAFSRKQMLQPKLVSLNEIVTNTSNMLRRLIGENIEISFESGSTLRNTKVDPGQIEQVLINLAVNARDAMPGGGKLLIETANVVIDESAAHDVRIELAPGEYIMLRVSDTGCGMDEETRARIFEPFFTTKEVGKGTGLGLSTVQGIIKQSGGDITVESAPEMGTTFRIYLPSVVEHSDSASAKKAESMAPGTETILLVEDEDAVRETAARALTSRGYTVIKSIHGQDALDRALAYPEQIDLVLTDVVMPEMNGVSLVSELRRVRPDLKALFMSGYTDDVVFREGMLAEGVPFLQKPFTPDALVAQVRAHLVPKTRAELPASH